MSFPVPGTFMIERLKARPRRNWTAFANAMISIHGEMQAVAKGGADPVDNLLKNAPHTANRSSARTNGPPLLEGGRCVSGTLDAREQIFGPREPGRQRVRRSQSRLFPAPAEACHAACRRMN